MELFDLAESEQQILQTVPETGASCSCCGLGMIGAPRRVREHQRCPLSHFLGLVNRSSTYVDFGAARAGVWFANRIPPETEVQRMLGLNEPPAVSMPVPRRARPRAELQRVLRQRTAGVPGTYVLLAANVAMFAAVAIAAGSIRSFSPRDLIWWGAGFGPRTTDGEWWRLLTATVLHAHLPHLIFNMIALLMVGPIVERVVGCRAFVAFYVACGLAGSAASLWANPLSVAVGASGAILGIYGMLVGFMFEHRRSARRNGFVDGRAPADSQSTAAGISARYDRGDRLHRRVVVVGPERRQRGSLWRPGSRVRDRLDGRQRHRMDDTAAAPDRGGVGPRRDLLRRCPGSLRSPARSTARDDQRVRD